MKVIAVIPVHGRGQLLKYTIKRLLEKNGCIEVICVGQGLYDKQVCVNAGAVWVEHANKPLGKKWNAGFLKARILKPDACLFVGSSDWLSDNWIDEMAPHLSGHGMVGTPGCHFADFRPEGTRLVYWPGYATGLPNAKRSAERANEPIGIGRMISAECLDAMKWKPIDDALDNSIDWSMFNRVQQAGYTVGMVHPNAHALSISCNLWSNKHYFEHHWRNVLPSVRMDPEPFLSDHFPEYKRLPI